MKKQSSFFFPLLLIAVGVVWLLVSMNVIPSENLWALTHIWPYLLIVLGLGLIIRSQWPASGILFSLLVVGGAVAAIVFAPRFGWADGPNWGDANFNITGGVQGSGKIEKETRQVKDFDEISIDYPAEVVVKQGKTESLVIEADDNLLAQLSTEVRNGDLRIWLDESDWAKRVNPTEMVKITITVKNLHQVDFSSAGSVKIEGLKTDSLKMNLTGAGDVELTDLEAGNLDCLLTGAGSIKVDGTADMVSAEIDGFGSFKGDNLESKQADATINGAGSVTLRVTDRLDAEINGAGSVGYYGTPKVNKNINGAGSVNQLGK